MPDPIHLQLDGLRDVVADELETGMADRCGARWALVLGDDEADRAEVRLKPLLGQGEEVSWAVAEIAAIVDVLRTP